MVVGVQDKGHNSFSSAATAYCLLLSRALVKKLRLEVCRLVDGMLMISKKGLI